MNKLKTIVIGLILSVLTTYASAEFRIGVSGTGISMDDVKGSETTTTQSRSETLEAVLGSVFIEKSFGPLTLGVDVVPYKIESEQTTNDQSKSTVDSGINTVIVDIETPTSVYALLGLGSTDGYLKVAYTEADIDTNENMGATSTSYPNAELEGTYIGIGVQKDLDNGFVRLEVGFSNYDDVSVTGSGGDGTANTVTVTGLEGMSARISLGKAF